MATYFPNSSSPRNVMPTMYLRDVNQVSFSEAMVPGSTVYMNYPNDGSFTENIANHSEPQQHSVDLPLASGILAQDSSSEVSRASTSLHGLLSNMVGSRVGEPLDAWRGGRNEMLLLQPRGPIPNMQVINAQMSAEGDLVHNAVTENSDANLRTQLGILHGGQGLQFHRSSMSMVPGQGLSLTLGTQIPSAVPISAFHFRHGEQNISFINPHHAAIQDDHNKDDSLASKQSGNDKYPTGFTGAEPIVKGDVLSNVHCQPMMKHLHMNPSPYSAPNLSTAISNSKYLKATQELLDEVVNVRKALKPEEEKNPNFKMSIGINGGKELESGSKASGNQSSGGVAEDANPNPPVELSPTERQELQMKLTQLLAMLDEVDRRYKQYYHQMQIVVSSFDAIAGYGAAKTYTALALQTISKHFRCLRDAISGQIQATRKSLGEQDPTSGKSGGLSRLRFVDQQLRQQRALQQLGMLQPHAWRPQRGLPESSVTILRAWLFEHFLHPYPKDSDKLMLARQTGLSRSQVSNWFINARVRLWKPMIEEMYKEETVDVDLDSISSSDNAPPKDGDTTRGSQDKELQSTTSKAPETSQASESNASKPETSYADMGGTPGLQTGPLVSEDGSNHGNMVFWDQRTNAESNLLQDAIVHSDSSGRFISYHMPGMGRFGPPPEAYPGSGQSNNNNVSLTLGLQHCDSGGLSASREQQNYITVRDEEMYNTTPVGASTSNYECLDVGNRRHSRFGSSQMLHDFVA